MSAEEIKKSASRGAWIMVIDDELDFLDSIRRGLIIAGYRNIRLLSEPMQVKELLKEHTFDLALIDLCMPQMDGLEVLEYILSVAPRTRCIMLSALDDAETAARSIQMGALDYLTKPISRKRLMEILDQALA